MMESKYINTIRDAAILLEKQDIKISYDLMVLAHKERPNGKLIQRKLEEYEKVLKKNPQREKVESLFESGELAIIPVGFRCHTKKKLSDTFGFNQASLPFDSGFFPPQSIVNILKNKKIDLKFTQPIKGESSNSSHCVCIKYEKDINEYGKKGIKFKTSSYEEINGLVKDKDEPGINKYLDSTFGYYTLDFKNKFVLAHYNWHQLASKSISKGIYDIERNLEIINNTLNKRIERMFEICSKAKNIIFVIGEFQGYKYMTIDDEVYSLDNVDRLSVYLKDVFGSKCRVVEFKDMNTSEKILNILT